MIKSIKHQISKLLVVIMCTSLMPTTIAFAEEGNIQETGTNVVKTTGSAVSVNAESNDETTGSAVSVNDKSDVQTTGSAVTVSATSDFEFDAATGTITGYNGSDSEIVIPSEINGVKVTSISDIGWGSNSIWRNYLLTSVTIPDSVTSIGAGAFQDCYFLTSINISDSVTSIGDSAFESCSNLQSITISDSVTSIGNYAFCFCALTSINIPDSVTSIGDGAFDFCSNLTSITIPDSVTSIGDHAFAQCDNAIFYVESEKVKQLLINAGVVYENIIVKTVSVTSVKLNNTSLSLQKGNTSTLTATVLPDNATNKEVTWSSSDANVATVDSNGKVTGVGAGSATITCTANDGSRQSATCLVTVINPIVKVSSIKLSILNRGDRVFTLVPTVSPSNATIKDVTWSSSNPNVVTVDSNGKATYVGKGSATITCTAKDGSGKSATMFVKNDYYVKAVTK